MKYTPTNDVKSAFSQCFLHYWMIWVFSEVVYGKWAKMSVKFWWRTIKQIINLNMIIDKRKKVNQQIKVMWRNQPKSLCNSKSEVLFQQIYWHEPLNRFFLVYSKELTPMLWKSCVRLSFSVTWEHPELAKYWWIINKSV